MKAGRARALAEVLRAPLLLSPVADVLSGWTLARWETGQPWSTDGTALALTALAGCSLLAAGMAQNALADREDDALRKPDRPLPSGALTPTTVLAWFVGLTFSAMAISIALPRIQPALGAIIVMTGAYHFLFKRWRLPGCLNLGILRGTCMGLGVLAAGAATASGPAVAACAAYCLYMTGASLHASTDDEASPGSASPLGLGLCVLVALALGGWLLTQHQTWTDLAGPLLLAWAALRIVLARRKLPPPAVTGTALSGLHLLHAGLVAGLGQPAVAAGILLLFGLGRRMLRSLPPS
jgi:4-hydroxybenzoate polyprenyltransferase